MNCLLMQDIREENRVPQMVITYTRGSGRHVQVYIYLMKGKGQIAQKGSYWGENRLRGKNKRKYKYLGDVS